MESLEIILRWTLSGAYIRLGGRVVIVRDIQLPANAAGRKATKEQTRREFIVQGSGF